MPMEMFDCVHREDAHEDLNVLDFNAFRFIFVDIDIEIDVY